MVDSLQATLAQVAAPMVRDHGGGVLCGQALMAACDTAMVVALTSLEPDARFRPMTTAQLSTSFLRPVAGDAGAVRLTARVLRQGKTLSYGEVAVTSADGKLVAHATTTYAYL